MFYKPISDVYHNFNWAVFPVLNSFHKFLRRGNLCIHLVHDECMILLKKMIGKFVKVDIRVATLFTDIDLNTSNQLADANMLAKVSKA